MHRLVIVALPRVVPFDLATPCEIFGRVRLADGSMEAPSRPVAAHHHYGGEDHPASAPRHEHEPAHHAHRHVSDLMAIVERADLSEEVRATALQAFRALAEAEGRVHGVAWERVHLHEVGALDALVDIIGSIEGFEELGVRRISLPRMLPAAAIHGMRAALEEMKKVVASGEPVDRPDLAVANNTSFTPSHGRVSVLLGNGDGTFQAAPSFPG